MDVSLRVDEMLAADGRKSGKGLARSFAQVREAGASGSELLEAYECDNLINPYEVEFPVAWAEAFFEGLGSELSRLGLLAQFEAAKENAGRCWGLERALESVGITRKDAPRPKWVRLDKTAPMAAGPSENLLRDCKQITYSALFRS
jgi:hypothetical protein